MQSDDPDFEPKATDVIGLYLNPPQHAAVFAADEKTAIQALDRLDVIAGAELDVGQIPAMGALGLVYVIGRQPGSSRERDSQGGDSVSNRRCRSSSGLVCRLRPAWPLG